MTTYYGDPYYKTKFIIEALDPTEYGALTDNQKETVRLIVSAGKVDMTDGSAVWGALKATFGDQSTTWANLMLSVKREYNETPPV